MAKEPLTISGHDLTNAPIFEGVRVCPACGRFITDTMIERGYDTVEFTEPGGDGCSKFLEKEGPGSFEKWMKYAVENFGERIDGNHSLSAFTVTSLY